LKIQTVAALAAAWSLACGPALAETKVMEGTEFPLRLEDTISSKTANEGDRFTVTLTEDVKLSDGTILRAGYRGVGEVVEARKNGALGKTGKVNLRVSYLKVGDQRVRLRAAKSAQGDHRTGTQVVTVVLVGVFAGFVKGKNVTIPRGTQFTGFADQDTVLEMPLAPPPTDT
jgi:DNA topoisomerase IB